MKVLQWGHQFSKIRYRSFVFSIRFKGHWVQKSGFWKMVCLSVCLSVCMYVCDHSTAYTKRATDFKFGTQSTSAYGTRQHSIFEKNRAYVKGTCHRTFWVLTMLQKNGSNDFFQNRCIVGPWRVLKIPQKLKDLYDLILVKVKKNNLI